VSRTGTTNWTFTADGGFRSSPSVSPDGTIYIGSCNGNLYALSSSGAVKRAQALGGEVLASPAIAADGTIYVTAISNHYNCLFSLAPTGETNWTCDVGSVPFTVADSAQFSSPSIGPDGSIYVGSMDSRLYSISPAGRTNWTFQMGAVTYASPSIGADGTIYIGADDNRLYAINADGSQKWTFLSLNRIESSVAIARDGTVYSAALDGFLRAFDSNGALKWSTKIGVVSASPSVAQDGSVVVSTHHDFTTLAFNGSGQRLWTLSHGMLTCASTAINQDGTIYLASAMRLYALNGTNASDNSSWPMFRKDLQRHSRALQCSILPPVLSPQKEASLTLNVETGRTYTVQWSSDLKAWQDLTNLSSQAFHPLVFDASGAPSRFYRLRCP